MQERGKNGITAVKKLKKQAGAEDTAGEETYRATGRKRKIHYPPMILHDATTTSSASSSLSSSSYEATTNIKKENIEEDNNDVELNNKVANLPFHRKYKPGEGSGEAKKKQLSSSAVSSTSSYNEDD
jgi:hypothetical protein